MNTWAQGDPAVASTPPPGTVERWAWDYVRTEDLEHKLTPPAPPDRWEDPAPPRRLRGPGRPADLRLSEDGVRAHRGALRSPRTRARLLSTFLHHELQAAELMCWALLTFPETPRKFREGLVRIALDEARHMRLYREHVKSLGFDLGEFPVRDWFWERLVDCPGPVHFVAAMGMGFEAGNLEHAATFANRFRAAGDEEGARIQETVRTEEIAHVRFGVHWFETWTGGQDFHVWRSHLPAPLSPMVMRGRPVDREVRRRAGLNEHFLDELCAWSPRGS